MKRLFIWFAAMVLPHGMRAGEVLLDEPFAELSKDWFWGLGTWSVNDGVLRGFESGDRRHGPVKMRRLALGDAVVECDFRLERGATFAGILFNGSQERGHLVHLVMARDHVRVLAHPEKGTTLELVRKEGSLEPDVWHHVRIVFSGETLVASIDERPIEAGHPCIAEEKLTFGLGGDSGGPKGEETGALEFRALKITKP